MVHFDALVMQHNLCCIALLGSTLGIISLIDLSNFKYIISYINKYYQNLLVFCILFKICRYS